MARPTDFLNTSNSSSFFISLREEAVKCDFCLLISRLSHDIRRHFKFVQKHDNHVGTKAGLTKEASTRQTDVKKQSSQKLHRAEPTESGDQDLLSVLLLMMVMIL